MTVSPFYQDPHPRNIKSSCSTRGQAILNHLFTFNMNNSDEKLELICNLAHHVRRSGLFDSFLLLHLCSICKMLIMN